MIEFEEASDFTEQERWAWREAKFCALMVTATHEEIAKRLETIKPETHQSQYEALLSIRIRAQMWEDMRWHLMKPYHLRKEREGYVESGLIKS